MIDNGYPPMSSPTVRKVQSAEPSWRWRPPDNPPRSCPYCMNQIRWEKVFGGWMCKSCGAVAEKGGR